MPQPTDNELAQPDSYDSQLQLIALFNANTSFMAAFPEGALEEDPTNVSEIQGARCAVTLAGEGDENRTGNTFIEITYIAVMIYIYDKVKTAGRKRDNVRLAKMVRRIIRANPTQVNTLGQQLWYQIDFRKPATTFYTGGNFRQSITFVELYSRRRSPGALVTNNPYG